MRKRMIRPLTPGRAPRLCQLNYLYCCLKNCGLLLILPETAKWSPHYFQKNIELTQPVDCFAHVIEPADAFALRRTYRTF